MTARLSMFRAGVALLAAAALSLVLTQPSSAADRQPPTGGPCAVTYTVEVQWPGGFEALLTIRNSGSTPINGWTVRFSYPDGQRIFNYFNVGSATFDGSNVQLTNATFNATVAPGGTVLVGLIGTWAGANDPPTGFTLNGVQCALG